MRTLRKIARDLWLTRGRTAFMIVALATGLTSVGAVATMRTVLPLEMRRSYVESRPASVTFDVGAAGTSDELLEAVRARPGVEAAERRTTRTARWRRSPEHRWGRGLLFVAERFEGATLARVGPERGAREPGPGEVLVERSALAVLELDVGATLELAGPSGRPVAVRIAGVVHEPALAPAATEQAGYFYATPELLRALGEPPALDELRVRFTDAETRAAVEAWAIPLARWLEGRRARWEVVGVVEEVAAPATAYVPAAAFVARTGQPLRGLRVATGTARAPEATRAAMDAIDRALAEDGVRVAATLPLELLFNAMGEHVALLIAVLLALAVLMAVIGAVALSSTMSTSVLERGRELAVLRAIGARPAQVRRLVLLESLFVTALSLPLAVALGAPLAMIVGTVIGELSFRIPLPLTLSLPAIAGWSLGSLLVAVLASVVPARAATRPTVREALGRV